ncbi:MAG: TlpA family protein disulfide reductase [Rikenellaceae bacterium]|nr:TlpA family protein disulfide reductase [Rikenellaceae bacterium]
MKKILIIALAALAICGCSNNKAQLGGEFSGKPNTTLYLESVGVAGAIIADSVKTNATGRFNLTVALKDGEATLYNLRCGEQTIPLIVSAGEKIKINAVPGLIDGYTVSGSEESALVKEVKNIMGFGVARLDSLRTLYNQTSSKSVLQHISKEFSKEYYAIKRQQIEFIVKNSGSLAAIYALNQRLPGDESLFNGHNDIVYYRLVADSVEQNYPKSPYLATLKSQIAHYDQQAELINKLDKAMEEEPAAFPELTLPDMYGKQQKLSELKGKVFLLDFWSVADQNATFHNAELKKVYEKYNEKGFEIYQVSVDTSKPVWVEVTQRQRLPWTTVCDFLGANSPAVRLYGVKSVPQNFLFDAEGNIVARNVFGDKLAAKVGELLKK